MPEDKNLPIAGMEKAKKPENNSPENNNIEKIKIFKSGQEKFKTLEIEQNRENGLARSEKEGLKNLEKVGESAGAGATAAKTKYQQRQKRIEKILEADLEDIYRGLPPNKQNEFKIAGERTAGRINELLQKGKFKAGQIIALIKKWLQLIPGVNKFFLEQETKIKSDAIIKLQNDQ